MDRLMALWYLFDVAQVVFLHIGLARGLLEEFKVEK
jgi:hypothetical protein